MQASLVKEDMELVIIKNELMVMQIDLLGLR